LRWDLKAEVQSSGFARMELCRRGSWGVDGKWLGLIGTAGEVEGLSQRSSVCGIMVICGQLELRVVVKYGRSKKCENGTRDGPSVAISGMMKFVAGRDALIAIGGVEAKIYLQLQSQTSSNSTSHS
jgi:hypothetical protein